MRCKKCFHATKVYDTRVLNKGECVQRRRECLACKYRFVTLEESKDKSEEPALIQMFKTVTLNKTNV